MSGGFYKTNGRELFFYRCHLAEKKFGKKNQSVDF